MLDFGSRHASYGTGGLFRYWSSFASPPARQKVIRLTQYIRNYRFAISTIVNTSIRTRIISEATFEESRVRVAATGRMRAIWNAKRATANDRLTSLPSPTRKITA